MTAVSERDPRWLSLALIPVPDEGRREVDLPTAYVPPSDMEVPSPHAGPLFAWRSE